jgi:hypothetical protein
MSKGKKRVVKIEDAAVKTVETVKSRRRKPADGKSTGPKEEMLFSTKNYILMGVGLLVIALGFILMMGGSMPEPDMWDNDLIFSFRRITLAPFLVITGFVIEIYAIFKRW